MDEKAVTRGRQLLALGREVQGPAGIDPDIAAVLASPENLALGTHERLVGLDAQQAETAEAHGPESAEHRAQGQGALFRQGQQVLAGQFRADESPGETHACQHAQSGRIGRIAEGPGQQIGVLGQRIREKAALPGRVADEMPRAVAPEAGDHAAQAVFLFRPDDGRQPPGHARGHGARNFRAARRKPESQQLIAPATRFTALGQAGAQQHVRPGPGLHGPGAGWGTVHGLAGAAGQGVQPRLPGREQAHEFRLAPVDKKDRRASLGRLVLGQAQDQASGLGNAPGHGQGGVPALVLNAYAQIILRQQFEMRLEHEAAVGLHPDFARQQARTGLAVGRGGHVVFLGQKARPAAGAAQGHFQNFLGGLAGLGVAGVVPQHAVGRDHMVDVMRAFFAAFDFPGYQVRDVQQGLGQHVQGKVQAGEKAPAVFLAARRGAHLAGGPVLALERADVAGGPAVAPVARLFPVAAGGFALLVFRIAEKGLGRRAALAVDAAAGLHATAAQAAFAAHVAGPVATPGHTVAQGPVDEAFQVEALGAGFAHAPDFVDGQLARQDDAVRAQGFGLSQRFGMGQIGQGG